MNKKKTDAAYKIIQTFKDHGHLAYFAGGWVRDFLMRHPSDDIDIATSAPVETIQELFPHNVKVGIQFGILICIVDTFPFEVATFRKDLDYRDGRRPKTILISTAKEDAKRRDFTINGMFYDPIEEKILDFVGGQEDLKKEVIRTIGDPNARFSEDRLRMIRAVRFSSRFQFTIDKETEKAIQKHALTLFPAVSKERVWQEFRKMAHSPHFAQAMTTLHKLGLLQAVFPLLNAVDTVTVKARVAPCKLFPKNCPSLLSLAQLFPELNEEIIALISKTLRISGKERELLNYYLFFLKESQTELPNTEWAKLYAHPSFFLCKEVVAALQPDNARTAWKQRHDERFDYLKQHIKRIQNKTPLVTAKLLKSEGILPGKLMGTLLARAEAIAITHNLQNASEVITLLQHDPVWPKEP